MMLEKEDFTMKLYKVDICLKNGDNLGGDSLQYQVILHFVNGESQAISVVAEDEQECVAIVYGNNEVGLVVADKYDGEGVIAYTIDNIEYLEILED